MKLNKRYTGNRNAQNQRTRARRAREYYDDRCFVCHKKFGKYFVFHHIRYVDGEKIYADFENSVDYNIYLCDSIKEHPQDFALLCNKHHHVLEMLKRFKRDRLGRLLVMVMISR